MTLELHYNVFGCFREPRADVQLAKEAIDAGFEGIWIGDHFLPWIDSRPFTHHTWSWFGTLMSEVPDVPVGTSVTCPMIRYRPPVLAQSLATLDNMYPGRLNLGVGTGEALNEAHFIDGGWPNWDTRANMMIEAIEIMRDLWGSSEYMSYQGEHFQYDNLRLYTQPKEDIPIHWAAWGPRSSQYAGKYADHLITAAPPDHIENRLIPNLEKGLDSVNRDLDEVDVSTEMMANIGDPDKLTSEIRDIGEYVPDDTELDNPDPRDIQRVADEELASLTDAEIAQQNNITNDPTEIIEEIEKLESAGVTRVLVGSNCGDPRATIDAFRDEIIPHFN